MNKPILKILFVCMGNICRRQTSAGRRTLRAAVTISPR